MKLSDAIMLGSTMIPWGNGWSFCDCALGMGLSAVNKNDDYKEYENAISEWPWLKDSFKSEIFSYLGPQCATHIISAMYFKVCQKEMTLEQLCDWVKSVEPAETVSVEQSVLTYVEVRQ